MLTRGNYLRENNPAQVISVIVYYAFRYSYATDSASGGEVWSRQQWWRSMLMKRQVVISGRRITNILNALLARLPLQLRFLPFLQSLIASDERCDRCSFIGGGVHCLMNHESHHLKVERKREDPQPKKMGAVAAWAWAELPLAAWHNHSTSSWKVCRTVTATSMRTNFELIVCISNIHSTYPFHLFS